MTATGRELNPEFVPEWDVYRDAEGNPVTITPEQVQAVWHAVRVVNAVRAAEGHRSLWDGPPEAEMGKSRLLGRMLIDGQPPTRTRPPIACGGPAWNLLPGGDPFEPGIDRDPVIIARPSDDLIRDLGGEP